MCDNCNQDHDYRDEYLRVQEELVWAKAKIDSLYDGLNNIYDCLNKWEEVTGLMSACDIEVVEVETCEKCDLVDGTGWGDYPIICSVNHENIEDAYYNERVDKNCPLRRKPRLYRVKEGVK